MGNWDYISPTALTSRGSTTMRFKKLRVPMSHLEGSPKQSRRVKLSSYYWFHLKRMTWKDGMILWIVFFVVFLHCWCLATEGICHSWSLFLVRFKSPNILFPCQTLEHTEISSEWKDFHILTSYPLRSNTLNQQKSKGGENLPLWKRTWQWKIHHLKM